MNNNFCIAIDGPSGAGKSTVAKILSSKLNIIYLDTGAMYRAVGLKVYNCGISLDDEKAIIDILEKTVIDIKYDNGTQKVFLDGTDVSEKIREHHISKYASDVSKIKEVRMKMVAFQRVLALKSDSVLDGRDIGTYVLPNAKFKFYLVADVAVRAKRRCNELKAKGIDCDYESIKKDIETRDYNDSTRDFAPLKKADDAIEINSTNLNIDEVVSLIIKYIEEAKN